jgi:hypothetical protein
LTGKSIGSSPTHRLDLTESAYEVIRWGKLEKVL